MASSKPQIKAKWIGEKLITPLSIGLIIFAATWYTTDERTNADRTASAEQSRTAREIEGQRAKNSERLENLRFVRQLAQVEGIKRFELGAPGVDLEGMDVSGLDLTALNMDEVNFAGVVADSLQTNNPKYQLTSENLEQVNWAVRTSPRTQMNLTNWDGAILGSGVQFGGANMFCASFRGARVSTLGGEGSAVEAKAAAEDPRADPVTTWSQTTDLTMADLRGIKIIPDKWVPTRIGNVILENADVRGVDFHWVNLSTVDWTWATYDDTTLWPEGYTPPKQAEFPEARESSCATIKEGAIGNYDIYGG